VVLQKSQKFLVPARGIRKGREKNECERNGAGDKKSKRYFENKNSSAYKFYSSLRFAPLQKTY
jgi:hypothetical protein